jgi:hypothetical protein
MQSILVLLVVVVVLTFSPPLVEFNLESKS